MMLGVAHLTKRVSTVGGSVVLRDAAVLRCAPVCLQVRSTHATDSPRSPAPTAGGPKLAPTASQAAAGSTQLPTPTLMSRMVELPGIYAELSKARLSALVVLTTGLGLFAPGVPVAGTTVAAAIAGTTLSAASANTFNQIIERKHDMNMKRTAIRPLPTGRISTGHALGWAVASGVAGVGTLAHFTNPLTAGLSLATIVTYAGIYTPLKRVHWLNTWVGAVVGAVPPVMGWTAVTGSLGSGAGVLAATLFLWQMPHFLSLGWIYRNDYAGAGYKMLPSTQAQRAANMTFRYSMYMFPVAAAAVYSDLCTPMFALEASVLNSYFSYHSYKFMKHQNMKNARGTFKASLFYLPLFLGAMVLHIKTNKNEEEENDGLFDFSGAVKSAEKLYCRVMGSLGDGSKGVDPDIDMIIEDEIREAAGNLAKYPDKTCKYDPIPRVLNGDLPAAIVQSGAHVSEQ